MTHPINSPMPGILIRQRDEFATWLRSQRMVRYDSHQVARNPGARWWIMRGSDGWVRAVQAERWQQCPAPWMRRKLSRAGIALVEVYAMRFKREPDSPTPRTLKFALGDRVRQLGSQDPHEVGLFSGGSSDYARVTWANGGVSFMPTSSLCLA